MAFVFSRDCIQENPYSYIKAFEKLAGRLGAFKEIAIMINKANDRKKQSTVTLKSLAEHVGLTAGTVSLVLNHAPQSSSIPQRTKDRIFAAATELNYRPNLLARALRTSTPPPLTAAIAGVNQSSGALMFADAEHLIRAINAIQKAGLRVPEDVSVVGAGNVPAAMAQLVSGEIA